MQTQAGYPATFWPQQNARHRNYISTNLLEYEQTHEQRRHKRHIHAGGYRRHW